MPRTPVALLLSEECWQFLLNDLGSPVSLSSDLRAILEAARPLRSTPLEPLTYTVPMLRFEASQLLDYTAARQRCLAARDPDRRLCDECFIAIEKAIKQAGLLPPDAK